MKIVKSKKLTMIAGSICALFLIIIAMCATSDWRTRWTIKQECGAGMDCTCFSNVIDNRLTADQSKAFLKFLKAVKRRPTANILEFTDELSARGISSVISICRPAQQPNEQQKAKGKK